MSSDTGTDSSSSIHSYDFGSGDDEYDSSDRGQMLQPSSGGRRGRRGSFIAAAAAKWGRSSSSSSWSKLILQAAASLLVLSLAGGFIASYSRIPLSDRDSGWDSESPDMKPSTGLVACAPFAAALNITHYHDVPLAPSPLPASHADSDGEQIIELFQNLGRSTVWKSIANITIEGDTFEPEGMLRLGDDRYIVSAGEYTELTVKYDHVTNGTDRTAGQGFSHLIVFNGKGKRLADATLTKEGAFEYHNGGLDFDGKNIWGTIAQYRPNTSAYAYTADPYTMKPTEVLHYNDHLGGIVHDTHEGTITCLNWGARNASTFNLGHHGKKTCGTSPKPKDVVRNPTYFIDYQDCKWLGYSKFYDNKSVMLCSGVATVGSYNLGGIALVDVKTMTPLAEVPITLESALGQRLTQNPVDVSVADGKLRLYWMPDQHNSTLYIYEAQPDSPFQFGGGLI